MEEYANVRPLLKRGSEFLGVKYPIICGAMTWVSEPKLVSAVANAGAFGCLAGGNAPTEVLRAQIAEMKERTDKPFAVNLITIAPAYHSHLEMLAEVKVPYIVFAGSFPREKEIAAAKATGAKVLCFASTISIAERMIRFGADAIILEGSEAGGHIGQLKVGEAEIEQGCGGVKAVLARRRPQHNGNQLHAAALGRGRDADAGVVGGARLDAGDAVVALEQLVGVGQLGLAAAQGVLPDGDIAADQLVPQHLARHDGDIPRTADVPRLVETVAVFEGSILHTKFFCSLVHFCNKFFFCSTKMFGKSNGGIIG